MRSCRMVIVASFGTLGLISSTTTRRWLLAVPVVSCAKAVAMKAETTRLPGVEHPITFDAYQQPHADHGGNPTVVVYFKSIETDQRVRDVA